MTEPLPRVAYRKATSRADARTSASSIVNGIGGRIFSDVVVRAVGAEQDALLAQPVDDVATLPSVAGSSVSRSRTSSTPMNSPEPRTSPTSELPIDERTQPLEQMRADALSVRLELLVLDDVQHRQADRARHGVAAERAEELHPVVERRRRSRASSPPRRSGGRCRSACPAPRCRARRPALRTPRSACRSGRSRSAPRRRCRRRPPRARAGRPSARYPAAA